MVAASPTTSRRLQFRLPALLVAMTLVAAWLGWQVQGVRQRKEFLQSIQAGRECSSVTCHEMIAGAAEHGFAYKPVQLSPWRRWLGDEAVEEFIVPDRSPARISRIRLLFPEAMILESVDRNGMGEFDLIFKPERERGDLIGKTVH
jgi:hypothetical protein